MKPCRLRKVSVFNERGRVAELIEEGEIWLIVTFVETKITRVSALTA